MGSMKNLNVAKVLKAAAAWDAFFNTVPRNEVKRRKAVHLEDELTYNELQVLDDARVHVEPPKSIAGHVTEILHRYATMAEEDALKWRELALEAQRLNK